MIKAGAAVGAYISPFTSPRSDIPKGKRAASRTASSVIDANGTCVFDPMTHAFGMPRAGDFRYYDGWELWPTNQRGRFDNKTSRDFHINRVCEIQASLNSVELNPTILLNSPDSSDAALAVQLAEEGISRRPESWLTIAGTSDFWSTGPALDAFVGQLDQLEPSGWVLTVVRDNNLMPPPASPLEVFGICRTSFALSQNAEVHLSYGDIAGLPAVAAGASTIGTGWDMRQRICAYNDFEERPAEPGQGQWLQRPLLRGLLGTLKKREYEILQSENSALSAKLTPGEIPAGMQSAFQHYAEVLTSIGSELAGFQSEERPSRMIELYDEAIEYWAIVQELTGAERGASEWITTYREGLDLFRKAEGWV